MRPEISHDWADESPEAKARWFQSLTVKERLEIFCELAELALSINPDLPKRKPIPRAPGGVMVLSLDGMTKTHFPPRDEG